MSELDVLNADGKKAGTVDLPAEIFDVQVNIPLIHQVVVAQQAAARQGTASTKTRGEVAGGGRKPYRQKGTGRARQGSVRAPQYAGGGIVHGPTPREYAQRTPKKMKAAALRGALSDRARDGRVHVVESLVSGETPSTKSALTALARVTERLRTLVVLERGDDLTWLSLRNVDTVHLLSVDQLNTYDVLVSDDVVFLKGAYESFARVQVVAAAAEPEAEEKQTAKKTAAKKTQAKKVDDEPADEADAKPAKKATAKKTPAKKTADKAAADAPAKKATAKKSTAKKSTAKKTTAKKAAADEEVDK
jgi:large subunit ribosomal protein L4